MRGVDDGIKVYDRHDPGPVRSEVRFKNPQAIVWVGVGEGLAEFMDERTFKHLIPECERKEEMYPRDLQAPYPCHIRPSSNEDTIPAGSRDTTC